MWIRSQDRERLVRVEGVYLFTPLCDSLIQIRDNMGKSLGTYSTKEKALKVLDEITKHINLGYEDIVFQMP